MEGSGGCWGVRGVTCWTGPGRSTPPRWGCGRRRGRGGCSTARPRGRRPALGGDTAVPSCTRGNPGTPQHPPAPNCVPAGPLTPTRPVASRASGPPRGLGTLCTQLSPCQHGPLPRVLMSSPPLVPLSHVLQVSVSSCLQAAPQPPCRPRVPPCPPSPHIPRVPTRPPMSPSAPIPPKSPMFSCCPHVPAPRHVPPRPATPPPGAHPLTQLAIRLLQGLAARAQHVDGGDGHRAHRDLEGDEWLRVELLRHGVPQRPAQALSSPHRGLPLELGGDRTGDTTSPPWPGRDPCGDTPRQGWRGPLGTLGCPWTLGSWGQLGTRGPLGTMRPLETLGQQDLQGQGDPGTLRTVGDSWGHVPQCHHTPHIPGAPCVPKVPYVPPIPRPLLPPMTS